MVWLLRYEDPKTKNNYPHVNTKEYFENFMKEIAALNKILSFPNPIPQIMTYLEAANIESNINNYSWEKFRHFILEAHNLVDKIGEENSQNDQSKNV